MIHYILKGKAGHLASSLFMHCTFYKRFASSKSFSSWILFYRPLWIVSSATPNHSIDNNLLFHTCKGIQRHNDKLHNCTSTRQLRNSAYRLKTEYDISSDNGEQDETDICDISRMPKQYRNKMFHVMQPPDLKDYLSRIDYATDINKTTRLMRSLYGKYGEKSGVNPGYLWPSKEELQELKELEKEFEPSLEERLRVIREEAAAEESRIKAKDKYIAQQVDKMPKLIDDYRARLEKTRQLEQKQKRKRKALMEEAREYFGYNIDLKDPRFLELQQRKEEEEKKLKKKKKKEEKAAKWLALIK